MSTYLHVLFFSLIGGVFSLIGGLIILSSKRLASRFADYATPFAAGALLSAVFLDLIIEGLEVSSSSTIMQWILIGILLFFLAERFLRWFHHHHEHEDKKLDPSISLIIFGDTLHNALDGVAIAAAFLVNVPTGIVTTIAVAAHEIPQEIGDFGLLLSKGMRRRSVLLVNILSALSTTVMALLTFSVGSEEKLPLGILLGLVSGFLLYIGMSDLIPSIHASEKTTNRFINTQAITLIAGVVIVWIAIHLAE